ncbi:arginine--tRNA ligase [Paracraurococcus ruber]|uniref:Arginine--tRNA ligase n=1 Tax=Paracraurococcus ruber TaxID=77675 RepID=A0ABS1D6E5_9PROT|nr:arginine--tRNA ligase [Paracraurococcus ruber]MBK1661837.1 arginine--tRNA ligase [Paracraurococcus ruber]TDG31827.1 arginine--tRNA ligase [Paracraurococcus ruber]
MTDHDIFAALRRRTVAALAELLPDLPADAFARVQMEPPRDPSHGDMATNAALVVGKLARQAPPKLAAALAERLAALPEVESAAPAGPGFVNLRLRESFLLAQLPVILAEGERYGDGTASAGRRINVEYVSANPTGPMHVGHCRGAVVGDALANLLAKAGWAVTKEYYINDAGAQVQALAMAAYWRYLQALLDTREGQDFAASGPAPLRDFAASARDREAFERTHGIALQYGGDYLVPVGQALHARFGFGLVPESGGEPAPATLTAIRDFTVERMMESIREDLAALGVTGQHFVSEAQLVREGKLEQAEKVLSYKGLIYRGVLEPPKGKTPEDWEPREQTLFRATQFGDEVDRPLRKSDGSGTYFANDIANHLHKLERGFAELVHVWGADHGGYVKRMQAAVAALSSGTVPLDVVLTQIVRVMKDGEPVRMSKRAGTFVTLRDLLEMVAEKVANPGEARDAVRFTMLTRKSDAQMEFDLDKVVEQSRENPVFYVQYAYARCMSVLRGAEALLGAKATNDTFPAVAAGLAASPLESLADPAELALIRRLTTWPRTVEAAAIAREPHRIAFFLHDLAGDFHVLWNKGRDDATLRFIRADEPEATRARLALVAATGTVIRSGLAVMGVTPVEEMR